MRERGQSVVEFAMIAVIMFMTTVGLIDAGLGFYQYNALSDLARFGARWGGVIGGACAHANAISTSDFCNQLGAQTLDFWDQPGNKPLQGAGVACPSYGAAPGDYYSVSGYTGTHATTIVAAVADHFDTTTTNSGFLAHILTTGFDLTKLRACIAISSTTAIPGPGNTVSVTLHYAFTPASTLLTGGDITFSATSQYSVE